MPAAILTTVAGTLAPAASADEVQLPRELRLPDRGVPTGADGLADAVRSGASAAASAHTVVPGDTPFNIAAAHGITVDQLLSWNGLAWDAVIYPGDVLRLSPAAAESAVPAPAAAASVHEVSAGDTLWDIALRYGTTVDAILAANGMTPGAIIYPGESLAIPGAAAAPAPAAPAAAPEPVDTYPSVAPTTSLDGEQAANAALIIAIGHELGVPERGIAIALAAAMVESELRNLDWGDRDSLGLFQQRPSTGWGTAEQILDRDRSIRAFYGGAGDPNGTATRGLLDIDGWEGLAFTEAAQAVQISAFPLRYGAWEANAFRWLAEIG